MPDLTHWQAVLVDDEPDSLNLIGDLLALCGAQVYQAGDGTQCLSLLETVTPTLVVIDLAMPKPDGWDVLAQIRANPATAGLPVVAITAYQSPAVEREAQQAGFDAFLSKPIKSDSFLAALMAVVGDEQRPG